MCCALLGGRWKVCIINASSVRRLPTSSAFCSPRVAVKERVTTARGKTPTVCVLLLVLPWMKARAHSAPLLARGDGEGDSYVGATDGEACAYRNTSRDRGDQCSELPLPSPPHSLSAWEALGKELIEPDVYHPFKPPTQRFVTKLGDFNRFGGMGRLGSGKELR